MEERGYTVVRCLGGGSQGRVYEAKDHQGRPRVIKQLPWFNEVNREDALREVRLLSGLRHPCIVPYLESFLTRSSPSLPTEDLLCLVMSRCEQDLRQECSRRAKECDRVEEPHALSWLAQLCWGLQHLHSRKFLHRDLKPQNVLLTQSGRVLLADFGVACHLEKTEDFRNTRVGTLAFMSPEMLQGRPYCRKTDQWALGCVLFEIMSLTPPNIHGAFSSSLTASVSEALSKQLPPGYSRELCTTLKALLAPKPDDRPSNAELLRGHLLRGPFNDFKQKLEAAASTTMMASSLGSFSGDTPRKVHKAAVTANMQDFLHNLNVSHFAAPEPSVTLMPRSGRCPFSGLDNSPDLSFSDRTGRGNSPQEADSRSYTSELEGCILKDSPRDYLVPPATPPGCCRTLIMPMESPAPLSASPPLAAVALTPRSEDASFSEFDADAVEQCSFALNHADLRANGWRQLLDEAETLLQPKPEARGTAVEELEKSRKQLLKILGTSAKVQGALDFLREREKLGQADDAEEEILLQVELVDLVGDEGLDALPLLERCLQLEASVHISGSPVVGLQK